jgi:hypothetical protein
LPQASRAADEQLPAVAGNTEFSFDLQRHGDARTLFLLSWPLSTR